MIYTISHLTKFTYSAPVWESLMEVRMQPRSEGQQRCLSFELRLRPRAKIQMYRDHLDNSVHHYAIPALHTQLTIAAEMLVETHPQLLPPMELDPSAWQALDQLASQADYWDLLTPGPLTAPSALLDQCARELNVLRRGDPLSMLREINAAIYERFDYKPQSTRVDSPIDVALEQGSGVCQDFAHIMIALVRRLGIPCRYVSGYLFHRRDDHDRSAADATHAWVEALLPDLGWVGFDPTNKLIAGERHIRVAVGRDYTDVPPTRGVYKGTSKSKLEVAVHVSPIDDPDGEEQLLPLAQWLAFEHSEQEELRQYQEQQQQQQQQQ